MAPGDVREANSEWVPRLLASYASVFLVALALRLVGIAAQNIWYDEHWTLRVALAPIQQLLDLLVAEEGSKPPLYFAFMHYWVKLGTGEFWLRAPSAIFGALDCVAAAAVGRQLFGPARGIWLGWLVVLSPFHIYFSQEARPYALWGLLVTLALLFHLKFCAAPRRRFLVGYVVFALLACYTFIYSFFLFGFSLLFTIAFRPALSKAHRSQMALANGIVLLLYLPWLWRVVGAIAAGVGFIPMHRGPVYAAAAYALFNLGLGVTAGPSMETLRVLGMAIFREAPVGGAMLIFGFLLLGVLAWAGFVLLWRTNRNALHFSVSGVAVLLGAAALLNAINPDVPLNPRYVLPAIVPLMVLIFAGCSVASGQPRWRRLLPILFCLTVTSSLANHYFNPAYERDDLRGAARFVQELEPPPERVIVSSSHLVEIFDHYFESAIPLEGLSIMARTEAEKALQPIHEKLTSARRFVLVHSRPDHGDPDGVLPVALQSRYRLSQHRHWTGVNVYVFEVPEPQER